MHFYPSQSFPGFWKKFLNLVDTDRCFSIDEVKEELESFDLYKNIKNTDPIFIIIEKEDFFLTPSNKAINFLRENLEDQYRDSPKIRKGKPFADPMLIAHAGVEGYFLVTSERKDRTKNIPMQCKELGIQNGNIADLLREEGWVF